jgi:D-aspartate ligase
MLNTKNFPNKPIAIVINSWVNGLGVIRSLGIKGIPVLALDPNPLAIGLYSKYAKKIICPDPLHSERDFVDFLQDIGKSLDEPGILFPSTDAYVAAIAKARAKLEDYYRIPFSSWEVIKEIVDKEKQYDKAMAAGIAIPKTFAPRSARDIKEMGAALGYPFILKPAYSHPFVVKYRIKAVKVNSPDELIKQFELYTSAGHKMLMQEIVGGNADRLYEFYSYTNREGEPLGIFVQRKLEQYPPDFGSGTVFESVEEPDLVELGIRLLKTFKYHGISFSEFKRDPRDGQFKLIEFNPRTTHCNSLSTECGVNLPYIAYQDMLGKKDTSISSTSNARWIFFEERFFKQRRIDLITRKGNSSLQERKCIYAIFVLNDPTPELIYFCEVFYQQIKKGLKKIRQLFTRTDSIYRCYNKYVKTKR